MALTKTVITATGLEANDAYHRVEEVLIIDKSSISFRVKSYKDNSEGIPSFNNVRHYCDYDITGVNPIAQAYEHLKTLPEFADAVDC